MYNPPIKSNDGNEYICGVVSEFAVWCEANQQSRWKILPEPRSEIRPLESKQAEVVLRYQNKSISASRTR